MHTKAYSYDRIKFEFYRHAQSTNLLMDSFLIRIHNNGKYQKAQFNT